MAWNEEIIPLVRGLIGDIELATPTYSDSVIIQYIIYAAHFTLSENAFPTAYAVDMSQQTISPDPSTPSRDTAFINIVALKAAIFILTSEAKVATSQAVRVNDGPSMVDMTLVYKAKMELLKAMQTTYDRAKMALAMGDLSVGEAIMSPVTVQYIQPNYYYR